MHKRGARVVLERFQQVVQPQVADVVVVEVECGQRLVLLESLAQQLGALVRVRVRVRVSILLTSCRTTAHVVADLVVVEPQALAQAALVLQEPPYGL